MKIWNIAKGSLVGGILLFILGMILQFIPWGINAVDTFPAKIEIGDLLASNIKPGMFFTDEKVAALISVKDLKTISYVGAFFTEFLTQLFAAAMISFFLSITQGMKDMKRLGIILIICTGAIVAIYVREINWWGFTFIYAMGMIVNLIVSWLTVTFLLSKLFYRSEVKA